MTRWLLSFDCFGEVTVWSVDQQGGRHQATWQELEACHFQDTLAVSLAGEQLRVASVSLPWWVLDKTRACLFSVESSLACPIEDIYFWRISSFLSRQTVGYLIDQRYWKQVQLTLRSLPLLPTVIGPDYMWLPYSSGQWTIACEGTRLRVRTGLQSGFSCSLTSFPLLLQSEDMIALQQPWLVYGATPATVGVWQQLAEQAGVCWQPVTSSFTWLPPTRRLMGGITKQWPFTLAARCHYRAQCLSSQRVQQWTEVGLVAVTLLLLGGAATSYWKQHHQRQVMQAWLAQRVPDLTSRRIWWQGSQQQMITWVGKQRQDAALTELNAIIAQQPAALSSGALQGIHWHRPYWQLRYQWPFPLQVTPLLQRWQHALCSIGIRLQRQPSLLPITGESIRFERVKGGQVCHHA